MGNTPAPPAFNPPAHDPYLEEQMAPQAQEAVRRAMQQGLDPDIAFRHHQMPRAQHASAATYEPQQTVKIRSPFNLNKSTLTLKRSDGTGAHRVSFQADIDTSCVVRVYMFATEVVNEKNTTVGATSREQREPPEAKLEVGHGQVFEQSLADAVDLSTVEEKDLKANVNERFYPLLIALERVGSSTGSSSSSSSSGDTEVLAQYTFAEFTKRGDTMEIRFLKQKINVGGFSYELEDIFGMDDNTALADADTDGSECVICRDLPRDTALLPCRHLCVCAECADQLRAMTNRCPICRSFVSNVFRIRVAAPAPAPVPNPTNNVSDGTSEPPAATAVATTT